jgi:hypothetical protein
MHKYTDARLTPIKRGHAYDSSKKIEFKPVSLSHEFGIHNDRLSVKRAVVELYMPELKGCSDEHIKRCAKEFFGGSSRMYTVIKLEETYS